MNLWKASEKLQRDGVLQLAKSINYIAVNKIKTKCYLWWSYQYFEKCGELPKMIWIDPYKIEYNTTMNLSQFPIYDNSVEKYGSPFNEPIVGTLGGPWDQLKLDWFDDLRPKSIKEKYVLGKEWKETEYHSIKLASSNNPYTNSKNNLEEEINDIDRLYMSMKKNGYMTQQELINKDIKNLKTATPEFNRINGESWPNECKVAIGRNGEFIRIKSAKSRITISKLLNIDLIPVIIIVRHKRWQNIRDSFKNARSKNELDGSLYKFIGHPDLQDVEP